MSAATCFDWHCTQQHQCRLQHLSDDAKGSSESGDMLVPVSMMPLYKSRLTSTSHLLTLSSIISAQLKQLLCKSRLVTEGKLKTQLTITADQEVSQVNIHTPCHIVLICIAENYQQHVKVH